MTNATRVETMRAIRLRARGGPQQLVYERVPRPTPASGEVLVSVRAAAITPTELAWIEHFPAIPSHEICGVVFEVGEGVTDVRIGDSVYGRTDFSRDGAAADYIAVRAADLAPKPWSLSDVQAAALPLSGLTAWQAFVDYAGLQAGQRVLIHGGAGGVGSLAVQLAHLRGAQVIATASASNVDFCRSLGADVVIDYTRERFDDVVRNVDVVLDTVGGAVIDRSWTMLKRGGLLISVATEPSAEDAARHAVRAAYFIVAPNRKELVEIARLADEGKLRPIVSSVFPLSQAREAFERGLEGHMRGKIVLDVTAG